MKLLMKGNGLGEKCMNHGIWYVNEGILYVKKGRANQCR